MMPTRRAFLKQASATSFAAGALASAACSAPGHFGAQGTSRGDMVRTVRGPIAASNLGFTLTHEHVCRYPSRVYADREMAIARAVEKLTEARALGVETLIDATTFDVGRDIHFGREVASISGMQIVACTGQHIYAPDSYDERSWEQIADLFIKEIEQGIDDTGVKAGVIKVASGAEALTPAEEKVFRAASHASKATGAPITTHTNSRLRGGAQQADLFEAEGVPPARVALGHCNDTDDLDYLTSLARRGFTLGMDHAFWGLSPGARLPWQKRTECISQLVASGFASQIFLSNDWVFGDLARDQVNPDGLTYTTRSTLPYLKQLGVRDEDIRTMTVENPRRFLTRA